jgi:glycine oxidase
VSEHTPSTDVVVIGAGLIGLGCAWRLAQRGLSVTVVDPAPAAAASWAAAGMLAPVSEVTYGEQPLLQLSVESLRRYPGFVAELEAATGHDVGLRPDGTLVVAADAGDRNVLTDLHAFQRSLGLAASVLTTRELRRTEPLLNPAMCAGLLVEADHSVDNRRLATALLSVVDQSGAALRTERVTHLDMGDHSVAGVTLADGSRIAASHVVLAAGPWSNQIDGVPASLRQAVRPVKGQILRLHAADPADLPDRTIRGIVGGDEVYLVPRLDGELVVGATVEDRGFDTTVTAGAVHDLLRTARAVLPVIDELELVESRAALRPGSPDNAPVVGATEVDGLIVATGHHRNGVLLTPLTADLVAGCVTGETGAEQWLELTSPRRLDRQEVPA